MSIFKTMTRAMAACALVFAASAAQAQEFDGTTFTCLQYANGQGENSSSRAEANLGRLWVMGYLAGFYKGHNKLELSAEAADAEKLNTTLVAKCKEFPQASLMAVSMQVIAPENHKVPSNAADDFAPATYTCGQHVDAKNGTAAEANRADLAELWAFAFIQGFKHVNQPELVIPIENKPVLVGAVAKNCANNRDIPFMDLTAMVANAVKLQ